MSKCQYLNKKREWIIMKHDNKHTEFIKWASFYDDGDLSTRSLASHKYFEERYNVTPIIIDSKNDIECNIKSIL